MATSFVNDRSTSALWRCFDCQKWHQERNNLEVPLSAKSGVAPSQDSRTFSFLACQPQTRAHDRTPSPCGKGDYGKSQTRFCAACLRTRHRLFGCWTGRVRARKRPYRENPRIQRRLFGRNGSRSFALYDSLPIQTNDCVSGLIRSQIVSRNRFWVSQGLTWLHGDEVRGALKTSLVARS